MTQPPSGQMTHLIINNKFKKCILYKKEHTSVICEAN